MKHTLDSPLASSNTKNVTERQKMWEILQHGVDITFWKPALENTLRHLKSVALFTMAD